MKLHWNKEKQKNSNGYSFHIEIIVVQIYIEQNRQSLKQEKIQSEQLLCVIFFYSHVVTGDKESRQRHSTSIKFFRFFRGHLWHTQTLLFLCGESNYIQKACGGFFQTQK